MEHPGEKLAIKIPQTAPPAKQLNTDKCVSASSQKGKPTHLISI